MWSSSKGGCSVGDPHLAAPNRALAGYARWHRRLQAFVVLRAVDPRAVLTWRVEAEEAMKAAGRPGLDRAAIEDYVRRFLPAYARYADDAPPGLPPEACLRLWLDTSRRVVPPARAR
jgi:pantothenate kinase-related protein Tda10